MATIETWLQQSLDPEQREQLVERNVHEQVAHQLLDAISHHNVDHHTTLYLVRLLRNLCAGNTHVAQYMLANGMITALATIATRAPPANAMLLKACAQLLCNAVTACAPCACGIWKALWPKAVLGFLETPDGVCVEPVALLTLRAAAAVGSSTLDDITGVSVNGSPDNNDDDDAPHPDDDDAPHPDDDDGPHMYAGRFWSLLLRHAASHSQSLTEGVVLLIQHVALSCGRLGCILHCVCPGLVHADTTQGVMHAHTTQPIIEQQQLASDVETGLQSNGTHEKSELIMNSMGLTMNSTSLLALQTALEAVGHVAGSDAHECSVGRHAHVRDGEAQAACTLTLCAAAVAVHWENATHPTTTTTNTTTTNSPSGGHDYEYVEALQHCEAAALEALRVLLAHQHHGARMQNPSHPPPSRHLCSALVHPPIQTIHQCTPVQMLLAMVGALPVVAHKGREGPPLVMGPTVAALAGMFPSHQPYPGYRTDVVAVLANVVYGDTDVQQVCVVVDEGGIEILLSQCVIDDASPMAKEWALLAIRNLCEGCTAAHERIKTLQAQGVVETEEMRAVGIKVEMGPTGKLQVTREDDKDA